VLALPISKLHSEGILFYLTTRMTLLSDVRVKAGNAALAAIDVCRRLQHLFQRIAFNVRLYLPYLKKLLEV